MGKQINPLVMFGIIALVVIVLAVVGYRAVTPRLDGPSAADMQRAMSGHSGPSGK